MSWQISFYSQAIGNSRGVSDSKIYLGRGGFLEASLEKSLEIPGGFQTSFWNIWASLIAQLVKNPPAMQETPFDSWVRKMCWKRDRLPTPVFLGFPCGYLREYLISKVILYKFLLEKLEIIEKYLKETRSHPQAHQPQISLTGIFEYLLPAVLLGIHRIIAYTKYSVFSFLKKNFVVVESLSCVTLCNPMVCRIPGFLIYHQLSELAQTHVHWVGDAIQPSHPPSSPSPPAFNLSQHQSLFQWVSSSHQIAKVLELQHQTFQWIFRVDFTLAHKNY